MEASNAKWADINMKKKEEKTSIVHSLVTRYSAKTKGTIEALIMRAAYFSLYVWLIVALFKHDNWIFVIIDHFWTGAFGQQKRDLITKALWSW